MTKEELNQAQDKNTQKIIDEAIQEYGDDFWNDEDHDVDLNPDGTPPTNRAWIIDEIFDLVAQYGYRIIVTKK